MKIYNSEIEFHHEEIDRFLSSYEDGFKITVMDRTEALYGDDATIDKEWCDSHNIPYLKVDLLSHIGCIIAVSGNILLDIKKKCDGGESICDKFSKCLCEYFKGRGMNSVRMDNNDVLVDDYKVASGAEVTLPNGFQFVAYQISIYQDLDTITHACTKPMVKVPKGLDEYGITTQEMVDFCNDYWTE